MVARCAAIDATVREDSVSGRRFTLVFYSHHVCFLLTLFINRCEFSVSLNARNAQSQMQGENYEELTVQVSDEA